MEKAEQDLTACRLTLAGGEECPPDIVCFHAQQAVEKFIKALLLSRGILFPFTHDISDLISRLADPAVLSLPVPQAERLTTYAAIGRYPADGPPTTLPEAREAAAIARKVRDAVRAVLPPSTLRPGSGEHDVGRDGPQGPRSRST